MATYEELRSMDPAARAAAWDAMGDDERQAVLEQRNALRAQANGAPSAADAAARGTLQGLTFGLSEEIGSMSRLLPGGETPQQYRDRKRAEMDQMIQEQPGAYLAGEVGGALAGSAIPVAGWLSGPARAARATSLTGRVATAVARGAVIGGTDAAAQAAGRAEGGVERVGPALEAVPAGVALGAVAGPLGELLTPAMSAITRQFGRTASVAVERNVREIARKTGMTPDEVLQRIAQGQPLAGMNDTTRMAARAIKNLDPLAGQQMIEATGPRLEKAVGSAVTDVQTSLLGPGVARVSNLRGAVEPALTDARKLAGETLKQGRLSAGMVQTDETLAAISDAVNRTPGLADELNTTLRISGGASPLFKKTPSGVQLERVPTVAEAEIISRELGDRATGAYQGNGGLMSTTRGEGFDAMDKAVRGAVDEEVPTLGPLRTAYKDAKIAEKEAFPLGTLARSTPGDQFALKYGPLADVGKDAARAGAAVRIGEDVGRTRRNTALIDEMMDPARYLGQNIDQMAVTPVNRAPGSPLDVAQNEGRLMDSLTGNSSTAGQAQAMNELTGATGAGNAFNHLDRIASTSPLHLLTGVVSKVLGSETGLDEAGLRSLAQMLMQNGPEGQKIMQKVLKRSPLTQGEEVSLARMARAAAGVTAASPTMPVDRAMEEVPSLMDIMGNTGG